MSYAVSPSLVRQLGSLFEGGSSSGLSDRQLLERITVRGEPADEAAFAAIVARHGPMVLGLCRQLLGDHHHAEDAFQATFLVLARHARSIREPDRLGPWLYGVALRTARKARGQIDRRRRTEEDTAAPAQAAGRAVPVDRAILDGEQAEALHVEIDRLPGAFRLPVVLCYFEGLTLDEAAHRLRWPVGTLRSRLARARDKLRRGLTRRGFALSGAAVAAVLAPRSARASVSSLLCDSTTRAATRFAARHAAGGAVSASAAALAQEVLRTMLVHTLKASALSLLLLATIAIGAAYHSSGAFAQSREGEPPGEPHSKMARQEPRPPESPSPTPGRMTVAGRVLDPAGKPVPNASVMVYGATKQADDRPGGSAPAPIGQAACDASGRFRIDMPRISSATHHMVGAAALAPGYGMGWTEFDVDADRPAADITLRPEQVIEGRLFDVKGRVIPGVRVSVEGVGHPQRGREALPEQIEGPHLWGGAYATTPPAWPRAATTDSEGRFTIRGIGRGLRARLMAEEPRFARQQILVDTDDAAGPKRLAAAMESAKVVLGRVTYADTGRPVPHAAIEIASYRGDIYHLTGFSSYYETDADGNFRANPITGQTHRVAAYAPEGQLYMNAQTDEFAFTWLEGATGHRANLALQRGAVIRGRVTEEGTGRPVAGAAVRYKGLPEVIIRGAWGDTTLTGPDGSYRLAVHPMAGTLVVLGPSEDYIYERWDERMVSEGRPGGDRWYAHAFVPCEFKPGTESQEVNVALRRGATVQARVVGPDGRPVREAWAFSRLLLQPKPGPVRWFSGRFHGDIHDGRFELHGLAPSDEVPVHFYDPKDGLGATVLFSVGAAKGGPITVRLEPCGRATARLVRKTVIEPARG